MKVLKFGGTSVGSAENIKAAVEIILAAKKAGKVAVIVSAFSKVTDQLIETANLAQKGDKKYLTNFQEISLRHLTAVDNLIPSKAHKEVLENVKKELKELETVLKGIYLIKELSTRTLDLICSFGERLSAYIISQSINSNHCPAEYLDARKLVKTDENFTSAKVDFEKTNKNIKGYFKSHKKLQIVTGFIGSTENNETTTLGRGGSDYSASIFGAALDVEEIQIWTDVNGIMTADPRKVPKAFSIKNISYEEAMEMSHFGAKVIHPPTMQPALKKGIPIVIKNTLDPEFSGSVISKKSGYETLPIKGVSSISSISLLTIQGSGLVGVAGTSNRLFGCLAKEKINVILISQASSEHSICFAIDPKSTNKAIQAVEEEFSAEIKNSQIDKVKVENDLSIIAVVGKNMKNSPGMAGQIFQALGRNGINVVAIAQGSSELNISIVIPSEDEIKAIKTIHDSLFLSDIRTINAFLVGPGLVGKTLLKQIEKQAPKLRENYSLEINIMAIANSKKMLFAENGIELSNWEKDLLATKGKMSIEKFIEQMTNLNLPNSVFVDCTSNEEIAEMYDKILLRSISIVTPNKKANSSDLKNYLKITRAAAKSNAKFFYETNVGAGLPVIKTLQDLLLSGDKILRIEAVLSGTLSYIFNSFGKDKKFSDVVKEAKEKGYTEPDPRDDLNGLDVARKLLILARENGNLLEMSDIEIENLVPENCRKAKTVEAFFKELEKSDNYFAEKIEQAQKSGKKLCYIAKLEDGKAQVSLQEIDSNHPFHSLSGSDNIVSFTTDRYLDRPLVIKGPGAGAEVTAAGIFADIIHIANVTLNTKLAKYAFLEKLKKNRLIISLIGMSNIGKTTWSKKLTKLGFKHINCDDLIEEQLFKYRKGTTETANWLGQPYEKKFAKNQKEYLEAEKKVLERLFKNFETNENIVIDTTGSVIYADGNILKKLKKDSLVIHIEASQEMQDEMYENFLKNPKPIVWGDTYKKSDGENNEEALERCYKELLKYRSHRYKEVADLVVPYSKVDTEKFNEHQFLSIIQEYL